MKWQTIIIAVLNLFVLWLPCLAFSGEVPQAGWVLTKTWESQRVSQSPFAMMAVADLNGNGLKEIFVTNFGRFGDHVGDWRGEVGNLFRFWILEWEKDKLQVKWKKVWDTSKTSSGDPLDFLADEAEQMVAWQSAERAMVETIPSFLGLEWISGKYLLREQNDRTPKEKRVGSWMFPWVSSSCYQLISGLMKYPRECLVGIRGFTGTGNPKVISMLEDEIVKNRQYKQTLRVRKFERGFPIEWEQVVSKGDLYFGLDPNIDRFTPRWPYLLLPGIKANREKGSILYLLDLDGSTYRFRPRPVPNWSDMGLYLYDLPDLYLRSTQRPNAEEYWSYHRIDLPNPKRYEFILKLARATLKPDLSGFDSEVIEFPYHELFLGVGYFDLQDVDGDGLDEVILIEETGKKELLGEESRRYVDVKDYIHILKWNGQQYQQLWVSPPYPKRGTKFLIEDIKNVGRKQLVVLTGHGTVEIWDRQ